MPSNIGSTGPGRAFFLAFEQRKEDILLADQVALRVIIIITLAALLFAFLYNPMLLQTLCHASSG